MGLVLPTEHINNLSKKCPGKWTEIISWFSSNTLFPTYFLWWSGTESNITQATNFPSVLAPDDDECGAVGGMKVGKGNRSTWRKHASAPLCPTQIPHELNWARSRTTAVESERLNACPIALQSMWERLLSNKQTPWPLVRERTIPTERPPLVDEI
jgi:hypothetical protein